MRNNTKEAREASRAAQFAYLIKTGYEQTDYKNLVVFTHPTEFILKSFWGTAANHSDFIRYRTAEQMTAKVKELIEAADRREAWKAEQKEKNKGKSSSHAAASAAIKAELAKAFPHVKFSVRSDSLSMGNSVDISWQNGPTVKQVEAISQKYQYGSFNGMEDIYETTNYRDDIPQAKYVSEHREVNEELIKQVAEQLGQLHKFPENDYRENADQTSRRLLYKTEIPATYTGLRVIVNPDSKKYDDYFCIVFDGVQQVEAKTEQAAEVAPIQTEAGKINIIEYGKGVAVVGDTKPVKEQLKAMGGRFNFRLTCGAGWVFPISKLEELKALLIGLNSKAETVKEEVKNEVKKTLDFFNQTDLAIYGEVTEATKKAHEMQNAPFVEVEDYENVNDIREAAQSGKIISLCNLSQLVNKKRNNELSFFDQVAATL